VLFMNKGYLFQNLFYFIGKGVALGLIVFALPLLLVVSQYDRLFDWYSGISDLPVFERIQSDFQTGSVTLGGVFREKTQSYYATEVKITDLDPVSTTLEEEDPTGWNPAGEADPYAQHKKNKKNPYNFGKNKVPDVQTAIKGEGSLWDRIALESHLQSTLPSGRKANLNTYLDYIEKHKRAAQSEMQWSKTPASITLAQGLLESDAGRSYLARKAKNHFGIKCRQTRVTKDKNTLTNADFEHHSLAIDCLQRTDDYAWDRFEVYPNVQSSYRRHSILLQNDRYRWMVAAYHVGENCNVPGLFFGENQVPYYAAWSLGLKKSGYATSKSYAEKLTRIIETYQLWKIDYELLVA
jgi:flagellum-specific peptidoglycan hydrolase FlgJ